VQDGEHQSGTMLKFAGNDTAEQSSACAIMNFDVGNRARESGVAIEDDDTIAVGSSCELSGESLGLWGGVLE